LAIKNSSRILGTKGVVEIHITNKHEALSKAGKQRSTPTTHRHDVKPRAQTIDGDNVEYKTKDEKSDDSEAEDFT
jgi:hypothetical protein